jgi:hypothetical protein
MAGMDPIKGMVASGQQNDAVAAGQPWLRGAGGAVVVAFVVAFAAGQRFTVPYVSAYACLVPVAMALFFWRTPHVRNAFVAMALLAKVDSSEIAYLNTLNALRFLIYAMSFAVVFERFEIQDRRFFSYLAYVLILVAISLFNHSGIDAYSLIRDVITLVLLLAVLGCRSDRAESMLTVAVLVWFSAGLLTAELVNLAFFYPDGSLYYLSYDSLKGIVVLASLYAMIKGRFVLFVLLFAGTVVVLAGYATRMLLLSYLVCIGILLVGAGVSWRGKAAALFIFLLGLVALFAVISVETLESNRVFSVIYALSASGDWIEYVRLLDPVRFVEHQLFFDRPILELVFGSGLGSGFVDKTGIFSFVPFGSGAFSDLELTQGRYFRLHDAWIYFGLRLGLVFVVLVYGFFIKSMLSRSGEKALLGALGFLVINTGTFSIAGLFMAALVAKQLLVRETRGDQVETHVANAPPSPVLS